MSICKFDEGFAGCCLWLSHADNRKDVPECWKDRLDEQTSKFDTAANKSIGLIIYLCETERARRKLAAASLCAPSALQDKHLYWDEATLHAGELEAIPQHVMLSATVQLCNCEEKITFVELCCFLKLLQFFDQSIYNEMHPHG